ncbi:hypothetical protein BDN72DRAFT_846809 [Pluteus cervinus]|uniref:Uncharacterized protein n=1 Tax=Pluteus cervinus TaxID=181527 RepID=A0ACD3AFI5_9AGAR|nr:hypothetical protein BDN72DRAFT_846809 [Pluteus cervinus]
MAVFPLELIENILAHAYAEYQPLKKPLVLHQCALVCVEWRDIAQSFIFSEILLSADIPDEKLDIFRDNSRLPQYVRTLYLSCNRGLDGGEQFLPLLPNVRQLCVLNYGIVSALLRGPTAERFMGNLTSLCLEGAATPFWAGVFYLCHSLRELEMTDAEFDFDETQDLAKDRPISRLRSLGIAGDRESHMEILQWMLKPQSPFDLTGLTTFRTSNCLDCSEEFEPYSWIQQIIKLCASSLRDLEVRPPTTLALQNPDLTSGSLLYPSTLCNLRVFTISIMQETTGDVKLMNYIPWMKTFFSLLPNSNRLEEIYISCTFMDYTNYDRVDEKIGFYDWEALDTMLTSSHFNLRRVVLDIDRSGSGGLVISAPLLREFLPGLTEKGILEIKFPTRLGFV